MTREQLIQKLRRYARRKGLELKVDKAKGKGSHYRVTLGTKVSTLARRPEPDEIRRFLKQIEVTLEL